METTRREFVNTISIQFKEWCKLKGLEPNSELFSEYLINRNLITDRTINRFLVVDKYPEALDKHLGIKKYAIWDIEDQVGVKESTIKVILNRFLKYFMIKRKM